MFHTACFPPPDSVWANGPTRILTHVMWVCHVAQPWLGPWCERSRKLIDKLYITSSSYVTLSSVSVTHSTRLRDSSKRFRLNKISRNHFGSSGYGVLIGLREGCGGSLLLLVKDSNICSRPPGSPQVFVFGLTQGKNSSDCQPDLV